MAGRGSYDFRSDLQSGSRVHGLIGGSSGEWEAPVSLHKLGNVGRLYVEYSLGLPSCFLGLHFKLLRRPF